MSLENIVDIILYILEDTFKKVGVDKKYLHLQVKLIATITILNIISKILPEVPTKFSTISCLIISGYYFIYYFIRRGVSKNA